MQVADPRKGDGRSTIPICGWGVMQMQGGFSLKAVKRQAVGCLECSQMLGRRRGVLMRVYQK